MFYPARINLAGAKRCISSKAEPDRVFFLSLGNMEFQTGNFNLFFLLHIYVLTLFFFFFSPWFIKHLKVCWWPAELSWLCGNIFLIKSILFTRRFTLMDNFSDRWLITLFQTWPKPNSLTLFTFSSCVIFIMLAMFYISYIVLIVCFNDLYICSHLNPVKKKSFFIFLIYGSLNSLFFYWMPNNL